jgi:membrane protease YdiL (CAAX protease family)
LRAPLLFAALVVLWGNAVSSAFGATAVLPGGSLPFAIAGLALVALSLVIANMDGIGLGTLLGRPRDALIGGAIGAASAVLLAFAAIGFLRLIAPLITGTPVEYAPLARVTAGDLARHAMLLLPLGIVVPEEVAFRGTLLAMAARRASVRQAVVLSAAAFALWHCAVIAATVGDTTLAPPSPWFWPAALVALVIVFAGGAVFAVVRLHTRTLATTVMAHWVFNAVLLVGLWWST